MVIVYVVAAVYGGFITFCVMPDLHGLLLAPLGGLLAASAVAAIVYLADDSEITRAPRRQLRGFLRSLLPK